MDAKEVIALIKSANGEGKYDQLRVDLEGRSAKALRSACSKLGLRPQATGNTRAEASKSGFMDMLVLYAKDRDDGADAGAAGPRKPSAAGRGTRSTKHCAFRLMNLLFSDAFADRLQEIDAAPTRGAIETGAINDGSPFWHDVAAAFKEENSELDHVAVYRAAYEDVNPADAVHHNSSKLRRMWMKLRARYTVANTRAHQSGTHGSDFFAFCDGRIDTLYLHDWLQLKPGLLSHVDGRLPKRARVDTMAKSPLEGASADSDAPTPKRPRTRRDSVQGEAIERVLQFLEAKATREAPTLLDNSLKAAQSASQLLQIAAAMRAASGNAETIAELEKEANELAKEAAMALQRRRNKDSTTD